MIIKIKKQENDYTAYWINENGQESKFDYIELIDKLSRNIQIDLFYENVDQEDEAGINKLFEEIKHKISEVNKSIQSIQDQDFWYCGL